MIMAFIQTIVLLLRRPKNLLLLAVLQIVVLLIFLTFKANNRLYTKAPAGTSQTASIFAERAGTSDKNKGDTDSVYDVHLEGNADTGHVHKIDHSLTTVAIGLALTSAGVENVTRENLRYKFPFFRSLLPSFCKTSTQGYSYHFYVAYDANDRFFNRTSGFQWFSSTFQAFRRDVCSYVTHMQLHLIQCTHDRKPAWAQNDAMMEAYLDHSDYYYRVNDDSMMKSPGWTETFITALQKFDPPNVGVVGPVETRGKLNILTYDFVHRKHIDIFGFYYPRLFTDWYADDWITGVYQPGRCTKVVQVKVVHTMLLGRRYANQERNALYLKFQIDYDKKQLLRYLERQPNLTNKTSIDAPGKDPTKVIAMALPSTDINFVHGVLRNIYLSQLHLPEWTVHIYAESNGIPPRILNKLHLSGPIQIVYSSMYSKEIPLRLLPYTVADNITVKYFIKRNALGRLSLRDAENIKNWIQQDEPFFCERDHPKLHNTSIIPGLFGAKTDAFLNVFESQPAQKQIISFLESHTTDTFNIQEYNFTQPYIPYASYSTSADNIESTYLNDYMLPKIKNTLTCYDSVHCDNLTFLGQTKEFLIARTDVDFVGENFVAFEKPIDANASSVFHTFVKKC